jgi:hypothetical protein
MTPEALAGGTAPEDQPVEILPVCEREVIHVERALGRVPARRPEDVERIDPRLVRARMRIHLDGVIQEAIAERGVAAVVGRVGIVRRVVRRERREGGRRHGRADGRPAQAEEDQGAESRCDVHGTLLDRCSGMPGHGGRAQFGG